MLIFARVLLNPSRASGMEAYTKTQHMQQKKKYLAIWWLAFLFFSACLGFAIYSHWEWLTLILPFQTTAFVKALDII